MSNERFRILVLADSSSFHTQRYVRELRRQNCRVLLASLERGSMLHYRLKRRGLVSALHYATIVPEIRLLIRRFRPQVVNAHFASGYGFAAALAKAGSHMPVVVHLWGSDILVVPRKSVFHRNKTRYAVSAADCVVGDSEYLLEQARRVGRVRKELCIPWGIEQRYLDLHRTDFTPANPLRIITPRPHETVYNNFFLVRHLEPLLRDGLITMAFPDWGSRVGEFRRLIERAGHDQVHLYSRRPRDEHMEFMASHDVYLSAALSDSSPASLIEAMALGLIPVAAATPGVEEWLGSDNGYSYLHAEPKQLVSVMRRLARSQDPHEQMRRDNLDRVRRDGVFERNVADTIVALKEASRSRAE